MQTTRLNKIRDVLCISMMILLILFLSTFVHYKNISMVFGVLMGINAIGLAILIIYNEWLYHKFVKDFWG